MGWVELGVREQTNEVKFLDRQHKTAEQTSSNCGVANIEMSI